MTNKECCRPIETEYVKNVKKIRTEELEISGKSVFVWANLFQLSHESKPLFYFWLHILCSLSTSALMPDVMM